MTATAREDERAVRDSYDRTPYPSASNHHAHPDRLAVVAAMMGLDAPDPSHARILELGCADGGNLIPIAYELPEARFVGIDLSPRQIETGRAAVAALGLHNIDLRALSILDVDDSLGTFDYIVCHGVFSWVAEPVQEKILELSKRLLAPDGVAYVSYNTLPGWHLRRSIRDMVRYHARNDAEPEARLQRAFEMVQFLTDAAGDATDAHAVLLRSMREQFETSDDAYLLHEYLEETNAPMYVSDLVRRAAAHGLQYLCDAEAELTQPDNLPDAVAQRIRAFAGDRTETEQYLDFVLNRTFRRTLLCHDGIALSDAPAAHRIRRLYASTSAEPLAAAPVLRDGATESFRAERKRVFSTAHGMTKAVLVSLAAIWPRASSFDELARDVAARLGASDEAVIADLLHALFWSGVVELHVTAPRCTSAVSERPRASALARRQADAGLRVTNQRRRVLKLDDAIARFLLRQLDGTRTRVDLVRLLDAEAAAGRLDISVDDHPIPDPRRIASVLQAVVEHHLRRMARYALLVG